MARPPSRPEAARRVCAAMQHHYYLAATDPVYRDNRRALEANTRVARLAPRTSVIRIPVVEHVLYHGDNENLKFDGFGKSAWPRDSYLNLWTCNLGGNLLGYATFPGEPAAIDGVVIKNTAFGSTGIAAPPYNLGRTAVHEVGHWLNLLHIWGDDNGGCRGSDMVDDTPNQAGSNDSSVRISSFPHITCNNGPNGDMFMNYMDYVDDDTMVMFTAGQLRRMNATLSGPRALLASSMGLTPVPTARLEPEAVAAQAMEGRRYVSDERGDRLTMEFDGVSWVPV